MLKDTAASFPLIMVAGRAGAGKSTVLQVFEDMGYFTMDGLPPGLIADTLHVLNEQSLGYYKGLVIGIDTRPADYFAELNKAIVDLVTTGVKPFVLYVEAQTPVLLRRYATTRRPHPLEREGLNLDQAMEEEGSRLAPLRELADLVLDTSEYSIHDLRRVIQNKWANIKADSNLRVLKVHIISFGFKYGLPAEAEMACDLRFLPNPYFVSGLKELTGKDAPVAEYVFGTVEGGLFYKKLEEFLLFALPMYEAEGRYRVSLAIGCTGGRHRSVAFAENLYATLKKTGYAVTLEHRHMELG